MVKVVWTEPALRDLDDIGEYIAKDSERYAQEVVRSLFETTLLINRVIQFLQSIINCTLYFLQPLQGFSTT